MTTSSDLAVRYGDNLISNAPVAGNLHECRPLFVDEYGILLCASGSLIHAISSKTGELIGNFTGHTGIITCIANCPPNAEEREKGKSSAVVVSSSFDGCLIVWNKKTFKEVSRLFIGASVYDVIIPYAAANGSFLTGVSSAGDSVAIINSKLNEIYLVVGKYHSAADASQSAVTEKEPEIAAEEKGDAGYKKRSAAIEQLYTLVVYNTAVQKERRRISSVRNIPQCVASMGTILGDRYLVVGGVKPKLTFWSESSQTGPSLTCPLGPITCLTTQKDSGLLVTGHHRGEIVVWHDIVTWLESRSVKGKSNGPPPASTVLHWHAHPVASVALSPDARYLFSGGDEGVLVVWQIATGIKDFVPRLGGAITFLSPSSKESRVAVTTADNTVRIVNTASMKEDWEMRSLFVPPSAPSFYKRSGQDEVAASSSQTYTQMFIPADPSYRCSIKIEERSGSLTCNGYPGQIQMLDLATQTFKTSHQVVQFTRVSKKEAHSRMSSPSTTHYDYLDTNLGSLMLTVDVRRGEESDAEASLKFWEWDAHSSKYRLSAQVDRPHGSSRVTSAIFSPSSSQTAKNTQQSAVSLIATSSSSLSFSCSCATAAVDGGIKIWVGQSQQATAQSEVKSKAGANAVNMHWSCSFSFKHRDCPAGAMSFSFDGSLLAACYENVITLWDPSQVQLWRSVVAPTRNNVTFTAFIEPRASAAMGGGAGEAMLVVGSKRSLAVYDLMTMKMMWSTEGHFSCFAVAADESAAIRCAGSSSSKSPSLTWIAASVKKDTEGTDYSEYAQPEPAVEGPYKILLFSPYSSKPLGVQRLRSKATSMTFWSNQKDLTTSLSSGLVALTALGEVLMIGATDALKQHFSDRSHTSSNVVQAKVFGQKLPTLPFSAVVHSYNRNTNKEEGVEALVSSSSQSAVVSKGWLEGMFDAKSGSIPPLSAIYDDFVGGLLNKQQQQLGDEGEALPFSAVSKKSKGEKGGMSKGEKGQEGASLSSGSSAVETLISADDDNSNAIFSDSRQKMVSEGLSSFFDEYVESNTSQEEAAPVMKSAVKSKKTEKRKADAL